MEARSSGHLDACVERRRGALLGRRVTGAERGCALRGDQPNFSISLSPFLIFKKIKVIQKDSYIRVSRYYNEQ